MTIEETFDAAAGAYVDAVGDEVFYNGEPVQAVFGSGFQRVASGDVRVASKRPDLYVRFADLPLGSKALENPPAPGDEVEVRERFFDVVTVKPDVEFVGADLVLKAQAGE